MPRTRKASSETPAAVTTAKVAKSTAKKAAAPKSVARAGKSTKSRTAANSDAIHKPAFDPAASRQQIEEVAYYLWLERNGSHGSPEEDWLRAEAEVRRRIEALESAVAAKAGAH
jgi:hypothetical protein